MPEPSMEDVFLLYQKQLAILSSAQKEKLLRAHDEGMSPFVMGCAILRAKREQRLSRERGKDKRISFNYVYRIIEDWLNHGITSEGSFRAYWTAVGGEKAGGGRGDQSGSAKTQIRREDFSYKTPPQQDKGFFPFLDE